MHRGGVGEVHRVGEVGEVQAKRWSSDLNRLKLPRIISNRSGMFRTVLLHIIPVSFVLSLHVFSVDLVQKITKNPI